MGAKTPTMCEKLGAEITLAPLSPSQKPAPKNDPQPEKGPETMKHQTLKIFNTKLTPEGGQKPKPTVKNQEKYPPPPPPTPIVPAERNPKLAQNLKPLQGITKETTN